MERNIVKLYELIIFGRNYFNHLNHRSYYQFNEDNYRNYNAPLYYNSCCNYNWYIWNIGNTFDIFNIINYIKAFFCYIQCYMHVVIIYLTDYTPCLPNPCESGGTCHPANVTTDNHISFTCKCVFGLNGDRCQKEDGIIFVIDFELYYYHQKSIKELRGFDCSSVYMYFALQKRITFLRSMICRVQLI